MIGITNAGGGGQLPFKIVGGLTQPSNPRDMTIWVKTSRPVTGWLFTSSPGAWADINGRINVVYKSSDDYGSTHAGTNCLFSKPEGQWWLELVGCYQSNGSKLEQVTAYVWSKYNQSWRQFSTATPPWDGYLFQSGNQYTDHTGGWTGQSSSSPQLKVYGDYTQTIFIRTVNMVDLTKFNTLRFYAYGYGSNTGGRYGAHAGVTKNPGQASDDSHAAYVMFQEGNTYSIDIRNLSGSYYIQFWAAGSQGQYLEISKVWLE